MTAAIAANAKDYLIIVASDGSQGYQLVFSGTGPFSGDVEQEFHTLVGMILMHLGWA